MKKILFTAFLVIIMAFGSACQPTPENPVVEEKNNLSELIKRTATPEPSASSTIQPEAVETWNDSIEFKDGAIIIEAIIEKPFVCSYPVYETTPHEITEKEAQEIVGILMKGNTIYQYSDMLTKSEIEDKIATTGGRN